MVHTLTLLQHTLAEAVDTAKILYLGSLHPGKNVARPGGSWVNNRFPHYVLCLQDVVVEDFSHLLSECPSTLSL